MNVDQVVDWSFINQGVHIHVLDFLSGLEISAPLLLCIYAWIDNRVRIVPDRVALPGRRYSSLYFQYVLHACADKWRSPRALPGQSFPPTLSQSAWCTHRTTYKEKFIILLGSIYSLPSPASIFFLLAKQAVRGCT